jgi:molybdopterin-dependent oxidoreductase alpha subunit
MAPRIGPEPPAPELSLKEKFLHALPFGIGIREKPRHYREMLRTLWENKGSLRYAWRILRHGVCDGCSLGPYGLKDDVMEGTHLCVTRLRLLRLNTMAEFPVELLADVRPLAEGDGGDLHELGRLPAPLIRYKGTNGFAKIEWEEAIDLVAERLRGLDPLRTAWFATSRGITNEGYYAFQKVARILGSPHVDYAARLCHAPSTYGLADVFGVGAPNCSLADMMGTDLLVLWGTNLANNQPVTTKYMHYAKEMGTRIVVVNPYREPGLEKYWIPSIATSAVWGTRLLDDYYPVKIGGDIAFMNGILKSLSERNGFDLNFLGEHATGYDELVRKCRAWTWEELEESSGLSRLDMQKFASIYMEARSAVFVYSMGLTQQEFGVQNVRSIATLAAARGMVGKKRCGVMAIRGHSGVQGGSEVGLAPDKLPGGAPVTPEEARKLSALWGARVPEGPGLAAPEMIEAAHEGRMDFLYSMGGNLLETLPDRKFVRRALERVGVRIHQDIVLNSSMLVPPGDIVLLLPAMTRYEMPGGGTTTSTERRIRYSPEIEGPRIPEAKPEWLIPAMIARRVDLAHQAALPWNTTQEIREEIERVVPLYQGISQLKAEGDSIQWGGVRLFEGGTFDRMPGGKCRLLPQDVPKVVIPPGKFHATTRRGKQFNSMIQGKTDPFSGRPRNSVLIHPDDARELGVAEGDRVRLSSKTGEMEAVVALSPVRRRTLQLYWPEANVLVSRRYDPISKEPDYNVVVDVRRVQ